MQNVIKKSVKNRPPLKKAKMSLKWPKSTLCVFRAAWSGTFSIPGGTTGPGFKAEIRPPPIFDHFWCFVIAFFIIYAFFIFTFFTILWICTFSILVFLIIFLCYWLKALLQLQEGVWWYVWWFSPHLGFLWRIVFFFCSFSCRGEYTG